MISAGAFRGVMLICATWLSVFAGILPGLAENTLVGAPRIEICSKREPSFHQVGTLKIMDRDKFVVDTLVGELTFHRDDFIACPQQVIEQRQCPPGQLPSANGCACPANETMSNGRCVAAAPPEVIPQGQPLPFCKTAEELTIQGSSTVGLGVMPALIKGFAAAHSFTVATSVDSGDGKRAVFQLRPGDREAGCFVITVLLTGSNPRRRDSPRRPL